MYVGVLAVLVSVILIVTPLLTKTGIRASLRTPQAATADGSGLDTRRPSFLVSIAILLLVLYQLSFNPLPDHYRVLFAAGISAYCLYVVTLLCLVRRAESRVGVAGFWLAVLLLTDLVGVMLDLHPLGPTDLVRKFFPFVLGVCLIRTPSLVNPTLAVRLAAGTAMLGSLYSLVGGTGIYNDVNRLTPFTGGLDGTHSSSYVLVCCLIMMVEGWRGGVLTGKGLLVTGVPAVLALLGLAVGTALIFMVTYLGVRFWGRVRAAGPRVVVLVVLVIATGFLGYQRVTLHANAEYESHSTGVDAYSSGRLSTWQQRVDIFGSRPAEQALVGLGVGSDLYTSPVWLTPKDSHEDFLTLLLENGVLGLLALSLVLRVVFSRAGPATRAQGVGFVVASVLSNALIARPMIECLFFVFLAATVMLARRKEEVDASASDPSVVDAVEDAPTSALLPVGYR